MAEKNATSLSSNFIPMEPEEITADWLFEVINQYRLLKEMSPVKQADDLISCEIAEKKSSKGRLSSTYVIDIKFKVSLFIRFLEFRITDLANKIPSRKRKYFKSANKLARNFYETVFLHYFSRCKLCVKP